MNQDNQKPKSMQYAYEVYISRNGDAEPKVFVYRGVTLDEVCAIALGLFRTCNVPNFCVVVYSVVAQQDLITFTKE